VVVFFIGRRPQQQENEEINCWSHHRPFGGVGNDGRHRRLQSTGKKKVNFLFLVIIVSSFLKRRKTVN
jgi:hypothetical protein